jgi:hypothetical protein
MRALINNMKAWKEMTAEIGRTSAGAVDRDMKRVLEDAQTGMDRLGNATSRLTKNLGDMFNASRAVAGRLGGIS